MISKNFTLSKTDLRILSAKLEKFEKELSISVKTFTRNQRKLTKTRKANIERRFRIQLQAVIFLQSILSYRLENGNTKRTKRVTGIKQAVSHAKRAINEIKASTK